MLIEYAKECKTILDLSNKINSINNTNASVFCIRYYAKKLGIYGDIKRIIKLNHTQKSKYSKEYIIELAKKSETLSDIGKHLNLCRERIRQIINKLKIKDEIFSILQSNRWEIKLPKDNTECIFSLYFENDPENKKFYSHTTALRKSVLGYFFWIKKGEKISHPIIKAGKKFGVNNLRWEVIKTGSSKELNEYLHELISRNIDNGFNVKMVKRTKERTRILRRRKFEAAKLKRHKKSKYKGVSFHAMSNLWLTKVYNPKTKEQKYLGYHKSQKDAYKAIIEWKKSENLC
jgi:hypothetical protein